MCCIDKLLSILHGRIDPELVFETCDSPLEAQDRDSALRQQLRETGKRAHVSPHGQIEDAGIVASVPRMPMLEIEA